MNGELMYVLGQHGPLTCWQSMREAAFRIEIARIVNAAPLEADVAEFHAARQGILTEVRTNARNALAHV